MILYGVFVDTCYLGSCLGLINLLLYWSAGLSDVPGLTIGSHPLSPIVFLKLKKSTGSSKGDLELLNNIADRVS